MAPDFACAVVEVVQLQIHTFQFAAHNRKYGVPFLLGSTTERALEIQLPTWPFRAALILAFGPLPLVGGNAFGLQHRVRDGTHHRRTRLDSYPIATIWRHHERRAAWASTGTN